MRQSYSRYGLVHQRIGTFNLVLVMASEMDVCKCPCSMDLLGIHQVLKTSDYVLL
jgi:hypothetical protein